MLNEGQKLARSLLYDPLVKIGIKALKAEFPFLAFPIVSQITDWLLMKYAHKFFETTMTEANMVAIALRTQEEKKEYLLARDKLLVAVSAEEKEKAKNEFMEKFSKLIDMRPAS